MAKCEICGKGPQFGHHVSFSMKHSKRQFKPNIQKATFYEEGRKVRKSVCTRCLKTYAKSN
ncbi:MAG TPA: 50S ribosomal protein L28 [Anaerolineae bacterium]|jgi:large subunit ribosomal protein L28|nr:50S ribosomal protein L28 [Anaerolineae bacterium]